MTSDRITALGAMRHDVVTYCRALTDSEWNTPSMASGWLVRDVVAHMGATCRILFSPNVIRVLRSSNTEQDNEQFVERRRAWSTHEVVAEFIRWSGIALTTMAVVARSPMRATVVRTGSLGRYPAWLLPSTFVFDWHTHLTYDIAPAVRRPPPRAGAGQLSAALEWMLAGLEQMNQDRMRTIDRQIRLSLTGPCSGAWDVSPLGDGLLRVRPASKTDAVAAHITGSSVEFPCWATTRKSWRDADLSITGDRGFAVRFLDAINIV